jgi:CheY-like chemotaxis protein
VIESEDEFAQSLVNAFSTFDSEVTVIADGKQGLQSAKAEPPDLILLRVELPRMSGYSICNKLKKDKNLKDIPLVIMSSEATDETFEQHRKLKTRAEDYIIKPFDNEELLVKVQALVAFDSSGGEELDEIITLEDDEAISLDDDEALTLDDDEAFSIDELADLDNGADEDLDLGESDSTVVMESPLEGGEDGLEDFDDVFGGLQASDEVTGKEPAPARDEGTDDLADLDEMLESLADDEDEESAGGAADAGEDDDLDLSALEDLTMPEDDDVAAGPGKDEAIEDDLLDSLVMDEPDIEAPADVAGAPEAAEDEGPAADEAQFEDLNLDVIEAEPVEIPVDLAMADNLVESQSVDDVLEEIEPAAPVVEKKAPPGPPAGPDPVLVTKLQNTEADNQILREKVAKLEERIEEMHASFEKRESELGSLRSKTTSKDKEFLALKSTINAKDREILEFKEELNRKDQEILEVHEKTAEREREIAKLQETIAGRDRDLKEQAEQLDGLRHQKNEIEETHAAKMADWEERYTKDTAQLEHKLQIQAEEHESALADSRQQVEQARKDLAKVKAEMDNTIQRHNDEVFGLRARSKQEQERLDAELSKVRAELEESQDQFQRECADHEATREAAARVPGLEADLEQSLGQVADLEALVAELRESIAENEERVVQAYQKIKNDEKLKQKARKAVEIAFTLLADEVSSDGESDAERETGDEAHT